MVPKGGRHATSDVQILGKAALWAVFVAGGARGDCASPDTRSFHAGDRGAGSVDPPRRSPVSCGATQPLAAVGWSIARRTAQWHAERSARRPKPTKLALNATLPHVCGGEIGRHRRRSQRHSRYRSCSVLEEPPGWPATESAMGQGMEPGADSPALADRLSGRRDNAYQPRSHLSGIVCPRPRSVAPRTDGLLANKDGCCGCRGREYAAAAKALSRRRS